MEWSVSAAAAHKTRAANYVETDNETYVQTFHSSYLLTKDLKLVVSDGSFCTYSTIRLLFFFPFSSVGEDGGLGKNSGGGGGGQSWWDRSERSLTEKGASEWGRMSRRERCGKKVRP